MKNVGTISRLSALAKTPAQPGMMPHSSEEAASRHALHVIVIETPVEVLQERFA
jgi:hypothetical protein